MQIKELLAGDPFEAKWEDYPNLAGFKVAIRLPDARTYSKLAVNIYDRLGRDNFRAELSDAELLYVIADWQGLTTDGLRQLITLASIDGQEGEIPYNEENLELLLKLSPSFLGWVRETVVKRQVDMTKKGEEEEKNSESSPSTSPIR